MKKEELFNIIGEVDEQKVAVAGMAMNTQKKSRPVWVKWGAMAACLCLVVVGAFTMFPYENWTEHQADDPNWSKTHFETAELSEIEAVCGTDLLLDKIALSGDYHSEYILEITQEGDFKNTDLWSNLSVSVTNGKDIHDQSSEGVDNVFCFISFDGDTGAINPTLWESDTTMELNGYSVQYSEKTNEEYAAEGITLGNKQNYHGYAVFTHNGYTYYLSTNSDNADFFDSIINQMLTSE